MPTTTLGKLRWELRGDWLDANTYRANDIVTYRNQQFICIQDTLPSDAGDRSPTNNARWTKFSSLFNFRGTWTNTTQYFVGDIVNQTTTGTIFPANANFELSRTVEQSYYCVADHTSNSTTNPIDTTYWTPINREGKLGAPTAAGSASGRFTLGQYSGNTHMVGILPNRGIIFDANTYYKGGGYKNTMESRSMGYVSLDGQCVTWGTSDNGSLGLADNTNASSLHNISFNFYKWFRSTSNGGAGVHSTPDNQIPRVIQWEKSYDRNLVLFNNGEVHSWGYGGDGQNGNGTNSTYNFPVNVGGTLVNVYNGADVLFDKKIKRIAMSGGCGTPDSICHNLALDENGQVWAWGYNAFGQLGINNLTSQNIPQAIPKASFSGRDIVAIWAMGNRTGWSFAVDTTGALWAWGYNIQGQLGVGDNSNKQVPVQVTGVSFGAAPVGSILKINALDRWNGSTGEGCSAILTNSGRVYTTGLNGSGWMGNNNTTALNVWTAVGSGPGSTSNNRARDMWLYGSGGNRANMLVRDNVDGICYTSGYNVRGQCARGGTGTTQQTTQAAAKMSIAGSLYDLVNVRQLGFASQDDQCSVVVVLDNGMALGTGENSHGQISNGTYNQFQNWADPNGIEETINYAFQLCRGASDMIGNMQDIMGFGYDSTNNYFAFIYQNRDGRIMVTGRGNQGQTAIYNAGVVDALSSNMMMPVVFY